MKNLIRATLLAAVVVACVANTLFAADQPRKGPVKVFILAGQSNMEGQAGADLEGKDYNFGKGTLKAKGAEPAKPTSHTTRKVEGWTVRIDDRLL